MKPDESSSNLTFSVKFLLRGLGYRNYRLFFAGQGISLIGTWMQQTAMTWLVYRLTDSAFMLGVVGFSNQIPAFILTPFGGVLADRANRHRVLLVTQILSMLQALTLALLVLTENIQVWHIIALGIFIGSINAFDIPTRQAFLLDMIENRQDLGNAIALNSSMFNAARLIGPSIAGVVIALAGEGVCFLLNALSFLAVLAALLAMRLQPQKMAGQQTNSLHGLREGLRYAFTFTPIRSVLFLVALASVMGIPYSTLMPVFARDILHGGSHTQGFLMSAVGLGALSGALFLASRKNVRGLGKIIALSAGLFGAGIVIFSFSKILWLSLFAMVLTGFGMMVQMASSNTVLQTLADDDKRGRVISLYATAFMGMMPFGSLLAGSLAGQIGAPSTLLIGGLCCILGALLFARHLPSWRQMVRPVYAKKGIIPEIAEGLRAATGMATPPKE
ncbi:MAG TPA: MFS transporter [Verrucomicrobiae bacterium]|nr:MFS transporter [Verrucomicrobiae bacterium]